MLRLSEIKKAMELEKSIGPLRDGPCFGASGSSPFRCIDRDPYYRPPKERKITEQEERYWILRDLADAVAEYGDRHIPPF